VPTSEVERFKTATTFEYSLFPFSYSNLKLVRSKDFKDKPMGKMGICRQDVTLLQFEGDVLFREVLEPIKYSTMNFTERSKAYRKEAKILGRCEDIFEEFGKANMPEIILRED
jgi:hypothetical protein